jgi:hypothetical protein
MSKNHKMNPHSCLATAYRALAVALDHAYFSERTRRKMYSVLGSLERRFTEGQADALEAHLAASRAAVRRPECRVEEDFPDESTIRQWGPGSFVQD